MTYMDLISREAVDNYVSNMPSELTEDDRRMIRLIRVKDFIADLPSAFDGMTNGEVIQALFPNAVVVRDRSYETVRVMFSDDVWRSPYKGVSE